MQTVTSRDGTRIAYDRLGSGPAVILVNPIAGDPSRVGGIGATRFFYWVGRRLPERAAREDLVPFMDLPAEVSYRVARRQHADGATHYKRLERKGGFGRSPIYPGSRRYESWRDLLDCGLLRTTPDWDREDGVPYRPPARNRTPAEA